MTLLRHADVFAPEPLGIQDVWIAAGKIIHIGSPLPQWPKDQVEEIDIDGQRLIPGLIDGHVHVTGGGGESGPASRVPPIQATSLASAGITTCIGLLGTDGTTRTIESLVARTLGLREEGLSAYCYTGSYSWPIRTLTGSVRQDMTFIDPIIGVGELALSDHRSSQLTLAELLRVASDVHVAGLMSNKAGVLHLHMGDGRRGLSLVRQALDESEIPARVFFPTHVNRQKTLFTEAMELTKRGSTIDMTAFPADESGLSAEQAISEYFARDLDPRRITCSSDGCGCLPTFDHEGRLITMDIGRPSALTDVLTALLADKQPLAKILPCFTSNVAGLLRLPNKGKIVAGGDADLVVLDQSGRVCDVMARGRWWMRNGVAKPSTQRVSQ